MNNCQYAILLPVLLLLTANAEAQPNTDRARIREKGIQSAVVKDKHFCDGERLEYDTTGRLTRLVQFTWFGNETKGYSYVLTYDTLGRYVTMQNFRITDSAQIFTPEQQGELRSSALYHYSGDSISFCNDTSWDESGRLYRIEQEEVHIKRQALPSPPVFRSVYHSDDIVAAYTRTWSMTLYIYADQNAVTPKYVQSSHGIETLHGRYDSGRVNYFLRHDTYSGDSISRVDVEAWYTLHGGRDTGFSCYRASRWLPADSTKVRRAPDNITYTYINSKKRLGRYYVRYSLPPYDRRLKLHSREPWLDYRFPHYPSPPVWKTTFACQPVLEYELRTYDAKPVYTYWSRPNR